MAKKATQKKITKADQIYALLPTAAKIDSGEVPERNGTTTVLAQQTRQKHGNATRNLGRLRELGLAHIHKYTEGLRPIAVWVSGPGKDSPYLAMSKDEHAKLTQAAKDRAMEKQRLKRQQARAAGNPNLTPTRELLRTLSTVERTRAAPRSWLAPLVDAQQQEAGA
jgi:hypothetical protein